MFIATQGKPIMSGHTLMVNFSGPLPTTTVDFWRLVWQERVQTIAMVANLVEGYHKKCHQYWPETGTQSFGPFKVTITDQQILAECTTRQLLVLVCLHVGYCV